ncbi:MAG TPA: gamma-glutamyl-gamma-aminobutyrate hydrolase family protein [Candidatus Dormibacteraeota bacterium]|jgi:putative glutamine amidotransferase|nr:gamma-glutamyl-gamma-aminobutyrate hydrolase family protein [Candidatus Dormibacteraeota bacterium]
MSGFGGGGGLPLVGVVGYLLSPEDADRRGFGRRDLSAFALNYFDKARRNGMLPLALTPGPEADVPRYLDLVEGLILTGGSDVDPCFYGEEREPGIRQVVTDRDGFELALLGEALRRGMPVLGVCRGHQVLNVFLGGSLHQDLPVEPILHGTGTLVAAYHDIDVSDPGLRRALGSRTHVNSLHHQAISRLGGGLEVAALAPDGVIEAVLGAGGGVLGVQWHPEQMPATDAAGEYPFQWLRGRLRGD